MHRFEGKPLVKDFIANTMVGIEYLWGEPVQLETSEVVSVEAAQAPTTGFATGGREEHPPMEIKWERVVYTMKERKLTREVLR